MIFKRFKLSFLIVFHALLILGGPLTFAFGPMDGMVPVQSCGSCAGVGISGLAPATSSGSDSTVNTSGGSGTIETPGLDPGFPVDIPVPIAKVDVPPAVDSLSVTFSYGLSNNGQDIGTLTGDVVCAGDVTSSTYAFLTVNAAQSGNNQAYQACSPVASDGSFTITVPATVILSTLSQAPAALATSNTGTCVNGVVTDITSYGPSPVLLTTLNNVGAASPVSMNVQATNENTSETGYTISSQSNLTVSTNGVLAYQATDKSGNNVIRTSDMTALNTDCLQINNPKSACQTTPSASCLTYKTGGNAFSTMTFDKNAFNKDPSSSDLSSLSPDQSTGQATIYGIDSLTGAIKEIDTSLPNGTAAALGVSVTNSKNLLISPTGVYLASQDVDTSNNPVVSIITLANCNTTSCPKYNLGFYPGLDPSLQWTQANATNGFPNSEPPIVSLSFDWVFDTTFNMGQQLPAVSAGLVVAKQYNNGNYFGGFYLTPTSYLDQTQSGTYEVPVPFSPNNFGSYQDTTLTDPAIDITATQASLNQGNSPALYYLCGLGDPSNAQSGAVDICTTGGNNTPLIYASTGQSQSTDSHSIVKEVWAHGTDCIIYEVQDTSVNTSNPNAVYKNTLYWMNPGSGDQTTGIVGSTNYIGTGHNPVVYSDGTYTYVDYFDLDSKGNLQIGIAGRISNSSCTPPNFNNNNNGGNNNNNNNNAPVTAQCSIPGNGNQNTNLSQSASSPSSCDPTDSFSYSFQAPIDASNTYSIYQNDVILEDLSVTDESTCVSRGPWSWQNSCWNPQGFPTTNGYCCVFNPYSYGGINITNTFFPNNSDTMLMSDWNSYLTQGDTYQIDVESQMPLTSSSNSCTDITGGTTGYGQSYSCLGGNDQLFYFNVTSSGGGANGTAITSIECVGTGSVSEDNTLTPYVGGDIPTCNPTDNFKITYPLPRDLSANNATGFNVIDLSIGDQAHCEQLGDAWNWQNNGGYFCGTVGVGDGGSGNGSFNDPYFPTTETATSFINWIPGHAYEITTGGPTFCDNINNTNHTCNHDTTIESNYNSEDFYFIAGGSGSSEGNNQFLSITCGNSNSALSAYVDFSDLYPLTQCNYTQPFVFTFANPVDSSIWNQGFNLEDVTISNENTTQACNDCMALNQSGQARWNYGSVNSGNPSCSGVASNQCTFVCAAGSGCSTGNSSLDNTGTIITSTFSNINYVSGHVFKIMTGEPLICNSSTSFAAPNARIDSSGTCTGDINSGYMPNSYFSMP